MNNHQHILVVKAYNNVLNNPLLDLWLRRKIRGTDLRLSQILKQVPSPTGEHIQEQLWTYVKDYDLKEIYNAFPEYDEDIEWEQVVELRDEFIKSLVDQE